MHSMDQSFQADIIKMQKRGELQPLKLCPRCTPQQITGFQSVDTPYSAARIKNWLGRVRSQFIHKYNKNTG